MKMKKSSEQRCANPFVKRGFRAALYRLRRTCMLMFGKCIPFILETLFRSEEKGERKGRRISKGKQERQGRKCRQEGESEKGRSEAERTRRGMEEGSPAEEIECKYGCNTFLQLGKLSRTRLFVDYSNGMLTLAACTRDEKRRGE